MIQRKNLNSLTIGEARDLFLVSQYNKGLSEATIGMDKDAINSFLKRSETSELLQLSIISEEFIEGYISLLRNSNISLSTQNINLSHLRAFLYWCMKMGYLEPFKIHLIKGQENKIKFFTDEEIDLLLKTPKKDCTFAESRTYAMICFIMSTGARASTIINLRIEDLDFKRKTITFSHLKNKATAIIPMSNTIYKVLRDYLTEWDRGSSGYVFCTVNENKMTVNYLDHALYKYCESRGVKPRGPHSLRHSFARMYIMKGGDAFSLQKILTHSSLDMTKRYVSLFSEDLRSSINTFSPLDNLKGYNCKTVRRIN